MTVTRRAVGTWGDLKSGEELLAIEKGQGLRKGEHQVVIGRIRVKSVGLERLGMMLDPPYGYGWVEVTLEGFPDYEPARFIQMFLRMHPAATVETEVRRIEFEHIEEAP